MTPSEQEKYLLIQTQSKTVLALNVSGKIEQDDIKDEEAAPILRLFSSIFDTQQSKDDGIDFMDFTIAALERFYLSELAYQVCW